MIDFSRYNGLSLDEIRALMNEALKPRGPYQDAWEEDEQYRAWRESAAMEKIHAATTTTEVRAVLRDLDAGRPL